MSGLNNIINTKLDTTTEVIIYPKNPKNVPTYMFSIIP